MINLNESTLTKEFLEKEQYAINIIEQVDGIELEKKVKINNIIIDAIDANNQILYLFLPNEYRNKDNVYKNNLLNNQHKFSGNDFADSEGLIRKLFNEYRCKVIFI